MQFLHTVHCFIFNSFIINIGVGTDFVFYKYINVIKKLVLKKDLFIKQHLIIKQIK